MRNKQSAVLESLRRAQQFLDTNGDVLAPVNKSTRKQLDDVVSQLSDLSVEQDSGARGSKGETARQRALRLALRRNYMAPIAELAKLNLRGVPEFAALMLPPASATTQRTVAAAYAMADAATEHAPVFVDNGLPETFAADLRTAAAAVTASITGRGMQQGRRSGATAGLVAEERRGRAILRVLNALVLAHIGTNAQLLAGWNAAKAVRRKPGPAQGSQAGDVTPVTPVTPIHPATVAETPAPASAPVPPSVPVAA
jgi:hypothetical protein